MGFPPFPFLLRSFVFSSFFIILLWFASFFLFAFSRACPCTEADRCNWPKTEGIFSPTQSVPTLLEATWRDPPVHIFRRLREETRRWQEEMQHACWTQWHECQKHNSNEKAKSELPAPNAPTCQNSRIGKGEHSLYTEGGFTSLRPVVSNIFGKCSPNLFLTCFIYIYAVKLLSGPSFAISGVIIWAK